MSPIAALDAPELEGVNDFFCWGRTGFDVAFFCRAGFDLSFLFVLNLINLIFLLGLTGFFTDFAMCDFTDTHTRHTRLNKGLAHVEQIWLWKARPLADKQAAM